MNAKRVTVGIAVAAAALLATGGTALAAGDNFSKFLNQDIGMTDVEIKKLAAQGEAEDKKFRAELEAAPQTVKISKVDAKTLNAEFNKSAKSSKPVKKTAKKSKSSSINREFNRAIKGTTADSKSSSINRQFNTAVKGSK